jgi:hypothetical protein
VVIAGTTYQTHIVGLIAVQQKFVALVQLLDNVSGAPVGGAIMQISGSTTPNLAVSNTDNKLTSSRIDLGLPYVPKYWYGFEVSLAQAMTVGQQVSMEYSLDDGNTWTATTNSALVGPTTTSRFTFLVGQVNPHIRYRVGMTATGGAVSPAITAIAAKFAPSNPQASVWAFTAIGLDQLRARNNLILDPSGKDILAFLFNIAQKSETVTYYDFNDSTRTPHTVWPMTVGQNSMGIGGTYSPLRAEGELDIVLWEVV